MTVAERIAGASNRLYDAVRSPRARDAVDGVAVGAELDSLSGHKYCLLTTFKRNGEAVPTPVWFGLADGKLYFRTYADAVKIKRLRRNPRVLVGPCDVRGKPKGAMIEAAARVLSKDEDERAERAIRSNYGLFRRLYEASFAMRVEGAYVEVTPA
jgi:PPOX class probable F420-dependent enzyme